MIATCTLNPAIDSNMEVESLVLDDTNRVVNMSRQAGGKGINVSRVVRELGGETVAYGFVGGYDGDMLKKILRRERVPFDFTAIRRDVRAARQNTSWSDDPRTGDDNECSPGDAHP